MRWRCFQSSWLALAALVGLAVAQQSASDLQGWLFEDRQALTGIAPLTGAGLFGASHEDGGPSGRPCGLERIKTVRMDEPRRVSAVIGAEFLGAYFDRLNPAAMGGWVFAPGQRQAPESVAAVALGMVNPVDQLAGIAVQTSIRLYAMETAIKPLVGSGPAVESRAAALMRQVGPWAWQAGVAIALLGTMLGVRWWRARRRSYLLPEFDHPARLGGAHAAGIGAVISFPTGGGPPTLQCDQLPDYPRRV